MKKKILVSVLFSIVCVLLSTVCFATNNTKNDNTMTEKIGNEITSSIKETEKSVDNLVNTDIVNNVNNGLNEDDDTNNHKTRSDMTNDVNKAENRIVAGTTGNYNAGEKTTNENGMSVTTWVWIILAVLAVIIIAAVWYYAAQRND